MKRHTLAFAITAAMVLMAVGAALHFRGSAGSGVNADSVVLRALGGDNGVSYVAQVDTNVEYRGAPIRTQAVVFHSKGRERIEYAGAGARPGMVA